MNTNVAKIRETETAAPVSGLALLRQPFPAHQISKLPKPTKAQTEDVKADFKKGVRCSDCGAWHHPQVVHLDYVGHAALTDRLLDADPHWSWEPVAFRDGLPAFDATGGLWIKLTVCGVTRLGYGHAATKPNQDPGAREKEIIGDGLRNAAMRFGAALDLWHKGDLHQDSGADEPRQSLAVTAAMTAITLCNTTAELKSWKANNGGMLSTLSDDDQNEIVRHFNGRVSAVKGDAPKDAANGHAAKQAAPAQSMAGDPFADDQIPF